MWSATTIPINSLMDGDKNIVANFGEPGDVVSDDLGLRRA